MFQICQNKLFDTYGHPELQKPILSQSKSLSATENETQFPSRLSRGIKYSQSLRVKRDPGPNSKADRSGWSFGNMAKALGTGMVQGTRAMGSGVVQGSLVVGSGVMQGSKAVSTGMVQGTKGVVQGTLAAGKLTKDVTLAVGKGVYHASEVVGNAAVTGVSAASEATISAGRVVTNVSVTAVMDTTKWVKEQCDEPEGYTVLPGDTLEEIAMKHNIKVHDLIRVNSLQHRKLFPGKQIIIPDDPDQIKPFSEETLVAKAFFKTDQAKEEVILKFSTDKFSAFSSHGRIIMECKSTDLVKIHLDICEILDNLPDLLLPHSVTDNLATTSVPNIEGEEKQVSRELKVQNCQIIEVDSPFEEDILKEEYFVMVDFDVLLLGESESQQSYRFLAFPTELLSIHTFLDLWHSEKLEISKMFQKHLSVATSGWIDCNDDGPQVLDKSAILDERSIGKVYRNLPQKIWNQAWKLAYSTRINGFSLMNLYRTLADDFDPCLIVINDTYGFTFGAFLTCSPRISESFIGTGKSWLFTFGRLEKAPKGVGRIARSSDSQEDPNVCVSQTTTLNVYQWSGRNEYFYKGTNENIFIGAGDGKFGIVIDGDLHKGRLQECQTFEGWAPQSHDFLINCLECWKFV